MKVNIAPYRSDIIPIRRLENKYEFARRPDTCYLPEDEYTWYDKLVFAALNRLAKIVKPLNQWSHNRERTVDIRVDYYDVYSADHTLALIIVPVLKKLREVQHGYPTGIDDDDVSPELRYTDEEKADDLYSENPDLDQKRQDRWTYVLNEMIWAFEQHADDWDEQQFFHNSDQLDMKFVKKGDEPQGFSTIEFDHQKNPDKPAYWVDYEGMKKHEERKANGRRLFAKYYGALWD